MSLYLGIGALILGIVGSLLVDISPNNPLAGGLLIFAYLAHRQGYGLRSIVSMCIKGIKDAGIVIFFMCTIGMMTASWRSSGVIAYFVYYGVTFIQPKTFIIIAFLITTLLAYAVGSSFAVSASMGVIFMALARAGGVDPVIVGGVLMSAVYVGERSAPSSSCAILVASMTKTDHMDNVIRMFRYGLVPLLVTLAIYCYFSINNPIVDVDSSYLVKLSDAFTITHLALIPAAIMLILPVLRVRVTRALLLSITTAVIIGITIQHISVLDMLGFLVMGYSASTEFASMFDGGGLVSMIETVIIVTISGAYAGIFDETDMLTSIKSRLEDLMHRTGSLFTTFVVGMLLSAVSCNQTFSSMMVGSLMGDVYDKSGRTRSELAADMQNTFVVAFAMMPWVIGCRAPLSFMGATYSSMRYAVYLYLLPLIYGIEKILVSRYKSHT